MLHLNVFFMHLLAVSHQLLLNIILVYLALCKLFGQTLDLILHLCDSLKRFFELVLFLLQQLHRLILNLD